MQIVSDSDPFSDKYFLGLQGSTNLLKSGLISLLLLSFPLSLVSINTLLLSVHLKILK